MRTDLVIDAFGADLPQMVQVAEVAESAGFDGVWTFDHLSGLVAGARWSRDPFVTLGAIAARTERLRLGVLVANVVNRHPAQLASAVGSLQSLAPGRVVCGMGSGAAPMSKFAVEQHAIGRTLDPAPERRARLVEHVHALRAIWAGARTGRPVDADGEHVTMRALDGVVAPAPTPPIVIGASAERTARVAARIADGVNIRQGPDLARLVEVVRAARQGDAAPFEISVFDRLDPTHPLGGAIVGLVDAGATARTLFVSPPYPLRQLAAIGAACAELARTDAR